MYNHMSHHPPLPSQPPPPEAAPPLPPPTPSMSPPLPPPSFEQPPLPPPPPMPHPYSSRHTSPLQSSVPPLLVSYNNAQPLFGIDDSSSSFKPRDFSTTSQYTPVGNYDNKAPPTYGNFESFEHNNHHYQEVSSNHSDDPNNKGQSHIKPLFGSNGSQYQFHSPRQSRPLPSDYFTRDHSPSYHSNPESRQDYHDFQQDYHYNTPKNRSPHKSWLNQGLSNQEEYWRDETQQQQQQQKYWSREHLNLSNSPYPINEPNRVPPSRYGPQSGSEPRYGYEDYEPHKMKSNNDSEVIKKVVPAESIFDSPGRRNRPSHIVIILRGLPGSGKSRLAKLIKDKEASYGAPIPRILSIDTYFVNEVEKIEKNPDTGRRVKRKVEEYEYDESDVQLYKISLLKQFNKTLSDGFFNMIIVDDVNNKISHFDQHWSNAKMKGYEAFVVELKENIGDCINRNIHNRTRQEIENLADTWEHTPPHFLQLDITSLLSPNDNSINEVDMDNSDSEDKATATVLYQPDLVKSRWEQDQSEDALDKLDGFKRKRSNTALIEEECEGLTLTEYSERKMKEFNEEGKPKKRRVRWADMEAAKEEQLRKEIGFTIGSKWSAVSEEEIQKILNTETNNNNNII